MEERDDLLWEVVRRAAGMAEADLIAGRLASEGIATRLDYEAAGRIYAITVDGLGEVRVLVPVADWERAREILERAYDEDDLPWTNPEIEDR